MTVTATNWLSLPLAHLRALVAASATFQALVGAADADAALDQVHLLQANEASQTLPHAVVASVQGRRLEKRDSTSWDGGGPLSLLLRLETPAAYREDENEAALWFEQQVGSIIEDMAALSGTGAYLDVQSFVEEWTLPGEETTNNGNKWWGTEWTVQPRVWFGG